MAALTLNEEDDPNWWRFIEHDLDHRVLVFQYGNAESSVVAALPQHLIDSWDMVENLSSQMKSKWREFYEEA